MCSQAEDGATVIPAPFTLRQAMNRQHVPRWESSVLLVIDAQNAYKRGLLALPDFEETLPFLKEAIDMARHLRVPVIHVLHEGGTGSPFDPESSLYQPIDEAKPLMNEDIIVKTMADAFAGTNLADVMEEHGRKEVIVVGYMTHNCVDATTRAAVHRGYPATVIAQATATRDLPSYDGETVISAPALHASVLSGLADAIATVVQTAQDIEMTNEEKKG